MSERSRSLIDLLQEAKVDLKRENPKDASLNNKTISAADVQKRLDEKTVPLEYNLGEKRSFAWVATNDSIEYFELPNRQKIEEKAVAFYDSILSKDKTEQAKTTVFAKDLSGFGFLAL